jgi:hypothetical protein
MFVDCQHNPLSAFIAGGIVKKLGKEGNLAGVLIPEPANQG